MFYHILQEEFSDDTSVADSKEGDKSSNSFDNFAPDAISSPHAAYGTEPKFYNFISNLTERGEVYLLFNAESRLSPHRRTHYSSCSSLDTLRSVQPSGIQKTKYASTTCLLAIGRKSNARFCDRKYSSRVSLAASINAVTQSMSSGFLNKTWSSKYASSLSISTITRSFSTKTINEDVDGFTPCHENTSSEQGYGTFESSSAFSNDVMEMNITSSDIGFETDSADASKMTLSDNIPTYDMNLLTPSKKACSLTEKPIESSSIDNLCLEDFDKDFHVLESMFDGDSSFDSKRFFDLRKETQELLRQTCIMNMDLLGNETETKEPREVTEFGKEAVTQADRRYSLDESDRLPRASSAEDLGINLSLSSEGKSSFEDDTSINTWQYRLESTDGFVSTDSEFHSPVDSPRSFESSKRAEEARNTRNSSRSKGSVSIPRASNIRKKTKVTRKRAERVNTVVTGLASRSPTKHMRSYIVLRQQSRYSDHERQAASTAQEDLDSASGNDSQCGKRQRKSAARMTKKKSRIAVKVVDEGVREKGDENNENDRTTGVNRRLFRELEEKANSDEEKEANSPLNAKTETKTSLRIGKV